VLSLHPLYRQPGNPAETARHAAGLGICLAAVVWTWKVPSACWVTVSCVKRHVSLTAKRA